MPRQHYHIPVKGVVVMVSVSEKSHLLKRTAHSRPARECLTLQKKAWLRATRSTPSLTGILSMWVEYSSAVTTPSLR
jgi:phosphoribosyl-dephospho-CoA transferase